MGDSMEEISSPGILDLEALRSRIGELAGIHTLWDEEFTEISDSDKLLKDCFLHFESELEMIMAEFSDDAPLGVQDLDALTEKLEGEHSVAEAENAKGWDDITVPTQYHAKDRNQLESNLAGLRCSLDFITSQSLEELKADERAVYSANGEDQLSHVNKHGDCRFEILDLDNQIENTKMILRSLQDLDGAHKRLDAIEQIDNAFNRLKAIEFEGNCIKLSLQTYIPKSGLCLQNVEDIAEPYEVNHELQIEVLDETVDMKNVKILPNDVYIDDVFDALKSFRELASPLLLETRSSLAWFVRKVQDRILFCTLRQIMVKSANKSRHSYEYVDTDETIIAHLVVGVDAFMKVSQGWPVTNYPLKLVSLKGTGYGSKDVSLSLSGKVEEAANLLSENVRKNLWSFVDAVEKIIVEQKHLEIKRGDEP